MPESGKNYEKFFLTTYALYKWVAAYTVILEKLDSNYVNVGAINELRAILSHLYSFIDIEQADEKLIEENYIKGRDHLERAYFDLFSALCTVLAEKILDFENKYSSEIISSEFPNYFTEIRPKLYGLYDDEGIVRSERTLTDETAFKQNDGIIRELKSFHSSLIRTTNAFERKKREIKNKKIQTLLLTICVPLAMVLIAFLLAKYFTQSVK